MEYIICKENENSRLDQTLAKVTSYSRSNIQKFIRNSQIIINGVKINKSSHILKEKDVVQIKIPEQIVEAKINQLDNITELSIVYEDKHLLVINKPHGLVVHPGSGYHEKTLVDILLSYNSSSWSFLNSNRPGIVHRLDKDTSGLMMIAKDDHTHLSLSLQIQKRLAKRTYMAICWGLPKESGIIKSYIRRSRSNNKKMQVTKDPRNSREAITHYKLIKQLLNGLFSVIECQLDTGRTHQIRAHMSFIGHSILGDQTYGSNHKKIMKNLISKNLDILLNFQRQALHASKLEFYHPITKEKLEFVCQIPEDMSQLIINLEKETT